jgi:hypothetical protein
LRADTGHSRHLQLARLIVMSTEPQNAAVSAPKGPSWDDMRVGLKVGPLTYIITPEMVADFCAALPASSTPYAASAAAADAVMPPTLLATDYIPLLHGKLELGWGLMVRHSLKILRPIKVGDAVIVTGEITDKYERKGRHYWTLRYTVQNAGGEVCLENLISCSVD